MGGMTLDFVSAVEHRDEERERPPRCEAEVRERDSRFEHVLGGNLRLRAGHRGPLALMPAREQARKRALR